MEKMNYIIETERLKLRELTLDDTEKLALVLSDPQSMRFYPHPFSREEVQPKQPVPVQITQRAEELNKSFPI